MSAARGLGARSGRSEGCSPSPTAPQFQGGRGCSTQNPTQRGCFARTRACKHVLHQFKLGRKSCLAPGASRAADSSVSGACSFCFYRQRLTGHHPRGKALPRQEVTSASKESHDGKQPRSPGSLRKRLCCARTGGAPKPGAPCQGTAGFAAASSEQEAALAPAGFDRRTGSRWKPSPLHPSTAPGKHLPRSP